MSDDPTKGKPGRPRLPVASPEKEAARAAQRARYWRNVEASRAKHRERQRARRADQPDEYDAQAARRRYERRQLQRQIYGLLQYQLKKDEAVQDMEKTRT